MSSAIRMMKVAIAPGDGTEIAHGAGGIGVTIPGHEGAGLADGAHVVPGGVDHAGVGSVDGISESPEVVGVLVVGGGGGVRCVYRCGGCHQADHGDDRDQGEEVQGLPGAGLDAVAAEGPEVGSDVDRLEHHDDDGGGSDREPGPGDDGVIGGEPSDEEAREEPEGGERIDVGFCVGAVLVDHPDAKEEREPDGEPSVVGGHGGDAGPAELVVEFGGESADRRAASVEESGGDGGCEDRQDHGHRDDDDGGHGDGEHPGLFLQEEEDEAVHNGEHGHEASSGEDLGPESDRDVVDGGDADTDQEDEVADDGDDCDIPSPDALDREGDEEHDRGAHDDGPESCPGHDDEGQEDGGENHEGPDGAVGEDRFDPVELGGIHCLEGPDHEVDEPCHQEAHECILGTVGEGGRHASRLCDRI